MIIPYRQVGLVEKNEELLRLCQGKRVLHLGCTDWPLTAIKDKDGRLLHRKLIGAARELVGLDYSLEGLEILKQATTTALFHCDLTKDCSELARMLETFDLVLCCDLLEHLANFDALLVNIKRFMSEPSELVITVPNSFALSKMLYILRGNKEKQHPEHTCSFSLGNLQQLLARYGLEVIQVAGFAYYGQGKAAVWAKKLIHRGLGLIGRQGLADELLIRARFQTKR
jgi:SAM-dependent methyltransferase